MGLVVALGVPMGKNTGRYTEENKKAKGYIRELSEWLIEKVPFVSSEQICIEDAH